MITFTDSHAHLTSDQVYNDIDSILSRSLSAGVNKIVNICTDVNTLGRGLELSKKYPWIHNVASTTPHDVEKEGEEVFPIMAECARKGLLVAVGETGLDYHYEHSNRAIQKKFLIQYLHLASECQLPVVIHCREAFKDIFEIIDAEYSLKPGLLHCFTGTVEEASELLKRNWSISFSGIITFKKSEVLREVVKIVPIEKILIETDTPYLAPQSYRGKVNEPSFLPEIAACIAKIKGLTIEEVAHSTKSNTNRFFSLN